LDYNKLIIIKEVVKSLKR